MDNNNSDELIVDTPISHDELALIRRHRGDPDYTPQSSFNPLHENWTDTEVIVLAPFFDMTEPPTIDEIERIMATHPALEARPGRPYYSIGLEILARYCFRHNKPSWHSLGLQLSEREGFQKLLQKHSSEK
jgi:hypothetical protein